MHSLQPLPSLNKTLPDVLTAFQVYLRDTLFLTSDLAGLVYFHYKGTMCKGIVELRIPLTSLSCCRISKCFLNSVIINFIIDLLHLSPQTTTDY